VKDIRCGLLLLLFRSSPRFGAPLALLTVPDRFSSCHKKAGRVEGAMNLYALQEFLGVLLVLAVFMGTILVLGVALILFHEVIRRALHGAKTAVTPLKGLSAKDQWLQGTHGRSVLR
jgi:hypothetical protein